MEVEKMRERYSFPKVAWLSLTEQCNNRCVWCYEKCNKASGKAFMGHEIVFKALGLLNKIDLNKVILIGGEPTLHPELSEIINTIKILGLKLSMVTNGRKLSDMDMVMAIKEKGIDQVTISVHGWSEQTYSNFTGSSVGFGELKDAIRNLRVASVNHDFNITLSNFTLGRVDEIMDFLNSQGIRKIGFNLSAPSVSAEKVESSFVPSAIEFRWHILEVVRKSSEAGIKPVFLFTMPYCIFSDDDWRFILSNASIISGCQLLHGSGIVICPDGSLALCNHLLDFKISEPEQFNDIFSNGRSFEMFWFSDYLSNIRRESNCFRSKKCEHCPSWNQCGSGCLVRWSLYNVDDVICRQVDIENLMGKGGT
ncbi:MAG TPA: radical SAM protein [bacterium]|jgi:radical SAM protein with 4Fe4S-binding SPASM domain|nr:radical SAM protein [bacterium]HPW39430.1 radical SAM protein [bacterium]HQA63580.1 radical SAM protein [bacterium]